VGGAGDGREECFECIADNDRTCVSDKDECCKERALEGRAPLCI
jgi:hypothetical protein